MPVTGIHPMAPRARAGAGVLRPPGRAAALLALVAVVALAPVAAAAMQVFTTADGLSSDDVRAVIEDRAGRLWFGTNRGVDRYDGATWQSFRAADGLGGTVVFDLLETGAGPVWAATDGGAARWDGAAWQAYGPAAGLPPEQIHGLIEGPGGSVWARTDDAGVARFDGAAWTRYTSLNGLAGNDVRAWVRGADGALWIATGSGVSRFDGSAWTTWTTADGLAGNEVHALLEARDGALWFATSFGVSRLRNGQWTTFTAGDGLARDQADVLVEDGEGGIWAGTVSGVSRWDGTAWRTYTVADGLADNQVDAAYRDRRGRVWLGARTTLLGVTRWDGVGFDRFGTADGLAAPHVSRFFQDRAGNLWLVGQTPASGITRFDGAFVRSWTPVDGLPHPLVFATETDAADTLWAGTATGLGRWDGSRWTTFRMSSGLPSDSVFALLEDSSGRIWAGTGAGVARRSGNRFVAETAITAPVVALYEDAGRRIWAATRTQGVYRADSSGWTRYRAADGLAADHVTAVVESRDGAMWFGTARGISRFDGAAWTTLGSDLIRSAGRDSTGALWFGTDTHALEWRGGPLVPYTEADGLSPGAVLAIHTTAGGVRWFCTQTGASRFDGERFVPFGPADGLAGQQVRAATSDARGRIWFGTVGGVSRLEPDRVPPRGVLSPEPALVSPSRLQSISFVPAFGEPGVEFSHAFDGEPFSPFTRQLYVLRSRLADGPHEFAVRARDPLGNVQEPPTVTRFEVDATAPAPRLARPANGVAVAGLVAVLGTTSDARFARSRVEVCPAGESSWVRIAESATPQDADTLARWDTAAFPDGPYELRVEVDDAIGLEGAAQIRVIVDNVFPFVDQTAPVTISAAQGGHAFTTGAELHVYFPPGAFAGDALVTLEAAADGVPDTVAGAIRIGGAFDLACSRPLIKPAALEARYAGAALPPGSTPAIHAQGADLVWRRLGGTHDPGASRVSAAIESPARIALFAERAAPAAGPALSGVTLTPRVLSAGRFGAPRVAIGFSLGRAGPVTVSVYNRAGRLVRTVIEGAAMGPGANLVHWDGRAADGAPAAEGVYLVAVRALGETRTLPLAVVR